MHICDKHSRRIDKMILKGVKKDRNGIGVDECMKCWNKYRTGNVVRFFYMHTAGGCMHINMSMHSVYSLLVITVYFGSDE